MSEREEIPVGLARQIDDMEIEMANLSTRAEAAEADNKRLREILSKFLELWNLDLIVPAKNGVGAFGVDEGEQATRNILEELIDKTHNVLHGDESC